MAVRPAPPIAITGAGAGPVLVVGTTGDAATPLASTRAMADALEDGHLVVVGAGPAHRLRGERLRQHGGRRLPRRPDQPSRYAAEIDCR